ncbi:MAG: altronate dehydrogenase [Verrucomicrobia bacterium]|nr:MAG: altronate dehydrogenase [Verrucomicrobiota bacterium]TAE85839.1 MAG: altronate dehydrogenase [Verrucomicrobiota bacterium]TAF23366.1 MAG: altronate dehydrogenase [Verrucomicrobiota bacterium]
MILQFGAGNFLRAFVDLFVSQSGFDKIIIVQSTGIERANALNRAGGKYHVAIQGFAKGQVVDETEEVTSISHALHAGTQWGEVLHTARDPELRWIVSNTTEAGFALDPGDVANVGTPASFPAKLLSVLLARHDSGLPGVTILPCELIEHNGSRLRELVLEQAKLWQTPTASLAWLKDECRWVNNLVDRIVPGPPKKHPLLDRDPLLLSAEPFAFWAIETTGEFELQHPAIVTAPDITPYYLRKVRILNGLHSALVCKALPMGIETVREAIEHPEVGPWLQRLLDEEIVPVLEGRVDDPAAFGRTTLDRFRNPFLEHKLSAIALNHEAKMKVRLLPTYEEYRTKFGRDPELLAALL